MLFALLRSYCAHFLRIKERQEPFGQPLGGSWAIYEACVFITEPGLTLAYLKCRAKWSAVIYRLSLQHFSLHPGPLCMKTNKTFVRQLTLTYVKKPENDFGLCEARIYGRFLWTSQQSWNWSWQKKNWSWLCKWEFLSFPSRFQHAK